MGLHSRTTQQSSVGDVDNFWPLVERYDRGLRALAFRLLGDVDSMDDALQETYLKAFKSLPDFAGNASIGTWLYRIAYNVCMDELRRKTRRPTPALQDPADKPDPVPGPAEIAAGRHDLGRALSRLPEDQRATVLLVDGQGMDYQQVAAVLGVSVGTVGSRLARARGTLRRHLDLPVEKEEPQ